MGSNKEWYKLDNSEVIKELGSDIDNGLTSEAVSKRLEENGLNKLKEGKKISNIQRFINQFKNVMIIVLLISAIVSGIVGFSTGEGVADTLIILFVVIANAILGMVQESKSEKAIEALQKLSLPYIKVKRNGKVENIKTEEIVVGDIVLLEAGDFVPADIRLTKVASLKSEEAALTGESVPVEKNSETIKDDNDIALGDRHNMVYSGSSITYGRAEGIVTAIGMNTELGKIAAALTMQKDTLTPLQKKMDEISKVLSIIVLLIAVIMFIFGVINGENWLSMFMIAVSLAVAAIPEGLPAVITITLAIGVQKMAKKNAIIRKLSAVETLGCTQIICSDKTGTLTQNKMTVVDTYIGGKSYKVDEIPENVKNSNEFKEYLNILMLCNDTKKTVEEGKTKLLGDPTETCLVTFSEKYGLIKEDMETRNSRVDEVPFDSDRKLMTTINKFENEYKILVKGATESILNRCSKVYMDGKIREITDEDIFNIQEANKEKASNAIRVLALAMRDIKEKEENYDTNNAEVDLVFVGLVGMIDPPRPEVKEAVKTCFEAGMTPIMITGDNRDTAYAIAKDLNIVEDNLQVMTGAELDKISDDEFYKVVHKYRVYARVSPEHKVKIVKAWKQNGKTVAMTGDGVNDAPALKTADIGIGMGITGTEVSKSVSSMILTDDNFATIVSAVEEGRRIYANIKKSIIYLLCSNLGEIVLLFFATLLFDFHVLLPIHILWINLVTDALPALALGMEKADKGIMKKRPRENNNSFFDFDTSTYILVFGIIKGLIVLAVAQIAYLTYPLQITAMTMSFLTLGIMELVFAFVARSKESLFKVGFTGNRYLVGAIALAMLLQIIVVITPLRNWFSLIMPTGMQWVVIICSALSIIVISEIYKLLLKLFNKKDSKGKEDKRLRIIPLIIMTAFIIIGITTYNTIMHNIESKHQLNAIDIETAYTLINTEDNINIIDIGDIEGNKVMDSLVANINYIEYNEAIDKIKSNIADMHSKVLIYSSQPNKAKEISLELDKDGYTRIYVLNESKDAFIEYIEMNREG